MRLGGRKTKKEAGSGERGQMDLGSFMAELIAGPLRISWGPGASIPFRISWGPGRVTEDTSAFSGVGLRKSED